jgi:hypothetical protein
MVVACAGTLVVARAPSVGSVIVTAAAPTEIEAPRRA